MVKILFAGAFAARFVEPVRSRLTTPCDLLLGDESRLLDDLRDADVLVGMAFTRAMAAAASRLGLVQVPGAGLDRIEPGAVRSGTLLANAYGHENGIAEYVIGAMLAMTRSFGRLDAKLRRGEWESQWAVDAPAPPLWPELAGKTLGILGYGHIGRALARRAQAFEMEVLAIRRQALVPPPDGLALLGGPGQLADVLRRADHLAVTVSLSADTRGLLGEAELRLLRPTACLVNVARAEVIDEGALFRALAEGRLAGAALDVWQRYPTMPGATPPANLPFHELDNVLMTPHVSGWTEGMLEARSRTIAENIDRTVRGEPPLNRVAPPP